MNLKTVLVSAASLFSCYALVANSSISVNDPRNGGLWARGTITSASVAINPQGDYFYYDLQLELGVGTVSQTDTYDSLEVSCSFDLPAGSFIKSAALLINNEWIDAQLMPRKEAHAIYEGIVQRRKDPLIIYKNYGDNYLFKIFPISMKGTRSMKITYGIASSTLGGNKSAGLPIDIIKASETPVDLKVLMKKSDDFPDPKIAGSEAFKQSSNPEYLETVVSSTSEFPTITSSKAADAVRFSSSTNKNDITYKFTIQPNEAFALNDAKKYLFIIDNDPSDCFDTTYTSIYDTVTKMYVQTIYQVNTIKAYDNEKLYTDVARMLATASSDDLFNIIIKNNGTYVASSSWITVSPAAIETAIANLRANDDSYQADIKSLLLSSTNLVNEDNVIPILLTNNKQVKLRDYSNASLLATEIAKDLSFNKTINVWDISSVRNSNVYYYYYGYYNAFVQQLAQRLSKANYGYSSTVYYSSYFDSYFSSLRNTAKAKLLLLNVSTHVDNGSIFDRTISTPSGMMPSNTYTEYGKITEGTTFYAEVSFRFKGKQYLKKYQFPIDKKENVIINDAWAVEITNALNSTYSTEGVAEAEKISTEAGVLTQNTSFLALEPGIEITPCKDCPDWNNWTGPIWRWNDFVISEPRLISFASDSKVFSLAENSSTSVVSATTPTNTTTTTGATPSSSVDNTSYYDAGYKAGKADAETNCSSSSDVAYSQGYSKGYAEAKAAKETAQDIKAVGDAALRAYPTPFKGELTIEVGESGAVTVTVYNASGEYIESFTVTKSTTITGSNSKLASLPAGVYILKAIVNGEAKQINIIKE